MGVWVSVLLLVGHMLGTICYSEITENNTADKHLLSHLGGKEPCGIVKN